MTQPRILIACIGNIFLGDDGFGVEVAKHLVARVWPPEVRVVDFGIRGFDLAYALLDKYDVTIFVDALPRGEAPGTLYVLEPGLAELAESDAPVEMIETHGMNPLRVLRLARALGADFRKILIVGCEPETLGPEEGLLGLSAPVAAAVGAAVQLVESLVTKIRMEQRSNAPALT
jgi:hydrogenase maturation protease